MINDDNSLTKINIDTINNEYLKNIFIVFFKYVSKNEISNLYELINSFHFFVIARTRTLY